MFSYLHAPRLQFWGALRSAAWAQPASRSVDRSDHLQTTAGALHHPPAWGMGPTVSSPGLPRNGNGNGKCSKSMARRLHYQIDYLDECWILECRCNEHSQCIRVVYYE
jgi:hypothetical protein